MGCGEEQVASRRLLGQQSRGKALKARPRVWLGSPGQEGAFVLWSSRGAAQRPGSKAHLSGGGQAGKRGTCPGREAGRRVEQRKGKRGPVFLELIHGVCDQGLICPELLFIDNNH